MVILPTNVQLLPVIGLCDYNPFGAALLMTYKVGSKTMALEGFGHQTSRLK
jgi:DNA topoisomerase VI subunit A